MRLDGGLVPIVDHANWTFACDLPWSGSLAGGGLQIFCAKFMKQDVLFRASQPFVLVPYHHWLGPFFKDGLNPYGGGVTLAPLKPDAPNAGSWDIPASAMATTPNEAIVVETSAATAYEPASAAVWAKFQVGNYQYIQRWEFRADGLIEPSIGLGGPLFGSQPSTKEPARSELRRRSHVHSFYFRLHFHLGIGGNQVVEEQQHITDFDSDGHLDLKDYWWVPGEVEGKRTFDPGFYTRWRIRHRTLKNENGEPVSWEIVPGSADPPDGVSSTGDFWTLLAKGGEDELGHEVETNDTVLEKGYGKGASIVGKDVILWYVLREHHRTASDGEEKTTLPYHFDHFTIRPRDVLGDTLKGLYKTKPASP